MGSSQAFGPRGVVWARSGGLTGSSRNLHVSVAEAGLRARPGFLPTTVDRSCFCKKQVEHSSPEEVQFSNTGEGEGSWQEVLSKRERKKGKGGKERLCAWRNTKLLHHSHLEGAAAAKA